MHTEARLSQFSAVTWHARYSAGKANHLQAVPIASKYGSERCREVLDFASVFVVTLVRNALVGLSY